MILSAAFTRAGGLQSHPSVYPPPLSFQKQHICIGDKRFALCAHDLASG